MWNLMQSKRLRFAIVQVVTGSLVALALPTPAQAGVLDDVFDRVFGDGPNPYQRCAADLTRSRISSNEAAIACSQALRPDDLGVCVQRTTQSGVAGGDALSVCRFVRRPVDASTCVADIRRQAAQATLANVLNGCRSSLLPVQFSRCVVGLNRNLRLATDTAIAQCISAGDPNDLPQTSIPIGAPPQIPVQTNPNDTTPGGTTPGFTTPGSTAPGSTTPGFTTPGSTTPGGTAPGSTTPVPPTTRPGTVTPQRF